jgi:alpha-mannosidase
MHRGTFTTKSNLKATNRRLEFKLRNAELLSVLRMLAGETYPAQELQECYKMLLLNQFHDILPGSHINPVYEDAVNDYKCLEERLDALIGTGEGWFNTLNQKRTSVTFIPDENGSVVRKGQKGFFTRFEIGSLSAGTPKNTATSDSAWIHVDGCHVRTPYYNLSLAEDGSLTSLYDLHLDREWTDGGFNKLHLYQDTPGMYDAWDILPNYKDVEFDMTVKEPAHLTFADSTVAEFTTVLATPSDKSTWKMVLRLFPNSPYIEVEHIVDWDEKHKLAKVEFSCNVLSRELVCDTSAGYIRRETHRNTSWQKARFEVCQHKWCDFAEAGGGIALINEGKYGLGVEENGMSLSLLRSNIRPDIMSDIGHHDFCYCILPHAGNCVDAGINSLALEYNVPPVRADVASPDWDFGGLYLQAVKLSEDGKSIVFRLSEQNGCRGSVKLPKKMQLMNMLEDVEGETDVLTYSPFELLTVAMPL